MIIERECQGCKVALPLDAFPLKEGPPYHTGMRENYCSVCVGEMGPVRIDWAPIDKAKKIKAKKKRTKMIRAEAGTLAKKMKAEINFCECCGWQPPSWADKVFGDQSRYDVLHMHHIKPVADGGDNGEHNLIIVCPNCHALAHRWTRQAVAIGVSTIRKKDLIGMVGGSPGPRPHNFRE